MDRKQIHKIGKSMNKPVKFVKNHAGKIMTVITTVVSVVAFIDGRKKIGLLTYIELNLDKRLHFKLKGRRIILSC